MHHARWAELSAMSITVFSVILDCCSVVKSSGDFYCFCLRQSQNCLIDSFCLLDDDAKS